MPTLGFLGAVHVSRRAGGRVPDHAGHKQHAQMREACRAELPDGPFSLEAGPGALSGSSPWVRSASRSDLALVGESAVIQ